MDNMSKAGLIIHEALYKVGRNFNDLKNSNSLRRLVAVLFTDHMDPTIELFDVFGKNTILASREGICSLKLLLKNKYHPRACPLNLDTVKVWMDEPIKLRSDLSGEFSCEDLYKFKKLQVSFETNNLGCLVHVKVNKAIYTSILEESDSGTPVNIINFMAF
jgi:hypothetical protein